MATLDHLIGASIEGTARTLADAGVSDLPGTASLVARRRRRSAATAGGASALALAALVTAGVLQDRYAPEPAAPPGPETIERVEVPLGQGEDYEALGWAPQPACGDPLPTASGGLEGLSQELQLWGGDGESFAVPAREELSMTTRLHYEGETTAPVFADAGYAVVAKDGVVVATFKDWQRASAPFGALDDGWSTAKSIEADNLFPCDAVGNEHTLPAGDYELYVISRVHATEAEVALETLRLKGYTLAPSHGQWGPGSIDCTDYDTNPNFTARSPEYPLPLECDPGAVPDASLDLERGIVSLPLSSRDYAGDVDVTLVSEPIRYVATEDYTIIDFSSEIADPSQLLSDGSNTANPADLACGVEFEELAIDRAVWASSGDTHMDDLASEAGAPLSTDTIGAVERVDVVTADSAQAWLLTREDYALHVVGSATATLSPSGTFTIDRWTGHPDLSLRLTDVAWCGEPVARLAEVVMVTPVTATSEEGTLTSEVFDILLTAR